MNSKLEDLPRQRWGTVTIPARFYNQVRLGLRRIGNPLRIETGVRELDIILENKIWYCVDRSTNDSPIVVWDEFQRRCSLHEPVQCRLSFFQTNAERVVDKVLQAVNKYLHEQLRPQ